MYSSSYHSQFHPTVVGHWPARPRRLITGLTTAVLMLFVPPQSRAHDGPHASTATTPAAPVTLKITGLQNAYKLGQRITGQVTVHADGEFKHGRVDVAVSDPDTCVSATQCPLLFSKSYVVNLQKGGDKTFDFSLPPGGVTAYTLSALLTTGPDTRVTTSGSGIDNSGHERTLVATATARFGIRQADLDGVPDTILKGKVNSLPMDQMEQTLQHCAEHGDVMDLNLTPDTRVKVKVQAQPILSNGVTIPGIGTPALYVGRVVNDNGAEDPNSQVNLLVVDGALSGKVARPRNPAQPDLKDLDTLFVDPLPDYVKGAGREKHLVYHHRHTVPPAVAHPAAPLGPVPTQEGEAAVSPDVINSSMHRLANAVTAAKNVGLAWAHTLLAHVIPTAIAQPAPQLRTYVMPIHIYEHVIDANTTAARLRSLNRAMSQFPSEFRNIIPRVHPDIRLTIAGFLIVKWESLSTARYGQSCSDDLATFRRYPCTANSAVGQCVEDFSRPDAFNTAKDDTAYNLLFTRLSTGCGGIGKLSYLIPEEDNFVSYPGYVIAKDTGGETYTAITILQEMGHTLDAHDDWTGCPDPPLCTRRFPHADHTSPLIRETWTVPAGLLFFTTGRTELNGCTAMNAGYDGCDLPEPKYHVTSTSALEHFAEGIRQDLSPVAPLVGVEADIIDKGILDVDFIDISVGADGSVWAIDQTQTIFKKRNKAGNRSTEANPLWDQAPGQATRIAVGPDGIPWVVNSLGNIFRKANADPLNGMYELKPGLASDIGVGADGSVWIIGRNIVPGGFGIYKWNGTTWVPVVGGAVRIAVGPSGNAWVVNSLGDIFFFDTLANTFRNVPGKAFDIGVGPHGEAVVIGRDGLIYQTKQTDPGLLQQYPNWSYMPRTDVANQWQPFANVQGDFGRGVGVDPQGYAWVTVSENGRDFWTANPQ